MNLQKMKESLEKELKKLQNSKEIVTIRCYIENGERYIGGARGYCLEWKECDLEWSEGYYDFTIDGGFIKAHVKEIRVDTEYSVIFVNY